jgi:hypothetical protein
MDYSYIPPHVDRPIHDYSPWPEMANDEPAAPIVFWIIWILLSLPALGVLELPYVIMHYYAQLMLATTWMALAPRVSARFFAPAALCYAPLLILGGLVYGLIAFVICLAMFGLPWIILRAFRMLALDRLQPGPDGRLITPALAEHTQFSLRTIAAVCVIVALSCGLWLGAERWRDLKEIKWVVALFVPCQFLMLLSMLSRAAWYWRVPALLLVPLWIYGWLYPEGRNEEILFWICLMLPADQWIVLMFLRRAGYRIGMPRSELADAIEPSREKQPQSPWD